MTWKSEDNPLRVDAMGSCCGLMLAESQALTKAAHSLPSAAGKGRENRMKGS